MTNRPNILYLMTDQQKASAASFLGNPNVPMPYMDSLAARGVVFENAYTPTPICTASRASVFTGVHPLVSQVTCHQNRAPHNLPQVTELLANAGYYCSVAGHYEPKRNLNRGWHEQVCFQEPGPTQRSHQASYVNARTDVGWSSGAYPEGEKGKAETLADRVVIMAQQIEAAKSPYFLHVAFDEPHPPFFVPEPWASMVDPDTIPLPVVLDEATPQWQRRAAADAGADLATPADIRRLIATYYGMIAYADDQMRRVVEALEARGLMENTWIILGSDHGDFTGEKGMYTKCEALYECLLHVPLVLCPPAGAKMASKRVDDLVDTVDLFPTMLSIAGLQVPEYAQGKDLLPFTKAEPFTNHRQALYAQVGDYQGHLGTSYPGGMPASGRHRGLVQGMRTQSRSYVLDPDNGDEAYDLTADPLELTNLMQQQPPAWAADMRSQIQGWETDCIALRQKLGVIPGYRGFDKGWE